MVHSLKKKYLARIPHQAWASSVKEIILRDLIMTYKILTGKIRMNLTPTEIEQELNINQEMSFP